MADTAKAAIDERAPAVVDREATVDLPEVEPVVAGQTGPAGNASNRWGLWMALVAPALIFAGGLAWTTVTNDAAGAARTGGGSMTERAALTESVRVDGKLIPPVTAAAPSDTPALAGGVLHVGLTWDEALPLFNGAKRMRLERHSANRFTDTRHLGDRDFHLTFQRPAPPEAGPYRLVSMVSKTTPTSGAARPADVAPDDRIEGLIEVDAFLRDRADEVRQLAASAAAYIRADQMPAARRLYVARLSQLGRLRREVRGETRLTSTDRDRLDGLLRDEEDSVRGIIAKFDE